MGRARELANLFSGGSADINVKTSDGGILNLQTSDTTVTSSSVLGAVHFQAPDEGDGTDAILLASKIEAIAEGTFSASSNATKLSFSTASSEAASEKMSLSSAGLLTVSGRIITDDTTEATSTTDGSLQTDGGLSVAKDIVAGDDIKLLSDSASIFFGADSEIELRHVADDGLIIKHVGTGDGKEPSLTFQAGDNDIAQDDVLGSIFFQAPDEGAGTDAVLVSAGIEAVSEGDFSSSSNATSLIFKTGASEAAAEKVRLTSAGLLKVVGDGSTTTNALTVGAGDDLKIFHGGTNSEIVNGTGALIIKGDDIAMNSAGGESMFSALSNDMVRLYFDNTEALRTTSGGGITIANGLTLTDGDIAVADGHGLSFAATSDASSSGFSELLDDYEEGVFGTAVTVSTAGTVTLNGSYNNLRYTKVGRLCTCNADIRVSSTSSPQGDFRVNVPFTSQDAPTASTAVNLGITLVVGITKQTGQQGNFVCLSGDNLSYINFQYDTATTRLGLQAENMGLSSSDEIVFSITYTTA